MPKLTKRTVDALAPAERRYYVWDSQLAGFGLVVLPTGVKSYCFQYRTAEGRSRRATIGKHGTWTAEEARDKAEEMRQIVKGGNDPLGMRNALREQPTTTEIIDAYLDSERFKGKASSTQAVDRGRIERHLKPSLGTKYVHLLTPEEIERARSDIRSGKTAIDVRTKKRGRARVRGGPGTARMAIELLRAIFSWAVGERIIPENPCSHVKSTPSGTRNIILESAEEYARLFTALDTMERERRIRGPVADAIRLIAFTGRRRGEVANLLWAHVDLKRGIITLPPAGHKTGRRTGKPRIIGLPSIAQTILARQPAGHAGDFVFRPAKGDGPLNLSHPWRKVRAEAELPQGMGLHGLRHSLASHIAMSGAQAADIMTALGHSQLSTAQRYVHWAQDARQKLAERAASVVVAGMAAATGNGDGAVVSITHAGRGPNTEGG